MIKGVGGGTLILGRGGGGRFNTTSLIRTLTSNPFPALMCINLYTCNHQSKVFTLIPVGAGIEVATLHFNPVSLWFLMFQEELRSQLFHVLYKSL